MSLEWYPNPATICEGVIFTQTLLNGEYYSSREAIGTAVPSWSPWSPDPSTIEIGVLTSPHTG